METVGWQKMKAIPVLELAMDTGNHRVSLRRQSAHSGVDVSQTNVLDKVCVLEDTVFNNE